MKNRNFIILLVGAALIIGCAFEWFKSTPREQKRVAQNHKKLTQMKVKAFVVNHKEAPKKRIKIKKSQQFNAAAFEQYNNAEEQGHNFNKDIPKDSKKVAKKDDKKKKDKKKKKKVVKSDKKSPKITAQNEIVKPTHDDFNQEPTTNSEPIATGVSTVTNTNTQNPANNVAITNVNAEDPNNEINESTRTTEEWSNLLLSSPNSAVAVEFSTAFNNGQVNRQTFYQIVESMVDNPDAQISALGLKTASEAKNAESFILLSDFIMSENKPAQNIAYARQLVGAVYSSAQQLTALRSLLVLTPQEENASINTAKVLALNTIKQAAPINLNIGARSPSQTQSQNEVSIPQFLSTYRSLVGTLQTLTENSSGEVLSAAQDAKSSIEQLLVNFSDVEAVNTAGI